jgi:two-component system NarL family response regulator
MAEKITVLVADDHAVVRAGLATILGEQPDITIVGEAADGLEATSKVLELKPDVILMDIIMPKCSGIDAMIAIRDRMPDARVLILTVSESEEDLFRALRFGAQGYLLKSANIDEVADAVRKVAAGEAMLSPNIVTRLIAEFRQKTDEPKLSTREMEVLQLLGQGLTNTQIASQLFISESTVRTYLRRLIDKLHLSHRSEAMAYAIRQGIVAGSA